MCSRCYRINSYWCRILQNHRKSCKLNHLPLDDSSLSLGTKIVKISSLEARVFSLLIERRDNETKALTPKMGIYRLPTRLKRLEPTMGLG